MGGSEVFVCEVEEGESMYMIADHPTPKFSNDGVGYTLNSRDYKGVMAVAENDMDYCCGNGQANQTYLSEKVGALNCMHHQQNVLRGGQRMNKVRRLTAVECERLQGFPDGWTDIGDWTDSKGKTHKCSDSSRYKALGNSIATPYWFVLMRRISAQYDRPATLGSLFDGIGGFPYCWERCNGKGTALWASEVDEFCIAVTKKHFGDDTNE